MKASEIIALIGLMVGLQALLMVFYLKAIEKVMAKQNSGIKQILQNKNKINNIHEILIGALSEQASLQRLYGAILIRISTHTNLPNIKTISSEIGEYDFLLEKSMHEVNLFSNDKTRNESAIRALSEEYGDLCSLELMNKSVQHNQKNQDLKAGIRLLKKRIENILETNMHNN